MTDSVATGVSGGLDRAQESRKSAVVSHPPLDESQQARRRYGGEIDHDSRNTES